MKGIVLNMNHYSMNQFAEGSLVPFINRFQSKKILPQLNGLIHHYLLTLYFSEASVKVVRWTAPPSVNAACQTLPGRGLGENDSPD
ncbi:hypothetical protein R950_000998 [Salmonella enterica subsp. enterica]|nr:hypothetical protein [Salmonella enterica subsp. enterica serovar Langford]